MSRLDDAIADVRRVEEAQWERHRALEDRDERTKKVERILTCSGLGADQVRALAELISVLYDGERDEIPDY